MNGQELTWKRRERRYSQKEQKCKGPQAQRGWKSETGKKTRRLQGGVGDIK